MYITKLEAKKHLNIDDFFEDDDNYILELIKVSEDIVSKRIDKKLSDCVGNNGELEPSIKHAVLLMVGTLYNNREATTPLNIKEVPYSFEYLADLNKHYHIF